MKARSSSNMGHVYLKTRSLGQIIEKPCDHARDHIYSQIFMELAQMIASINSWSSLNMDYVGFNTSSLGQIIEKPCEHSIAHIYRPIFMKLGQNDCLYEISIKF